MVFIMASKRPKNEVKMAVRTFLHINVKDFQGYDKTLSFGIVTAAFGAAVNLPTAAHIEALINSIFGVPSALVPSDSIVTSYSVEVMEDAPTGAPGGEGGAAVNIAARVRSNLGTVDEWEVLIPGVQKNQLTFGVSDTNSINTVTSPWPGIRTAADAALLKITSPKKPTTYIAAANLFQEGVLFTGKRSPRKPR